MNISTSLLSKFTKKEIDMLFKAVRVMGKIPAALLLGAPATQEYGRLLLVVSKKTGNAPQRNKLRRRLKDIFYKEKLFSYKKDCIFIAKNKEINNLSFDDLKLFMKKNFGKN